MSPLSTSSRSSPPQQAKELPIRKLFPAAPLRPKSPESHALTIFQAFGAPLPAFQLADDFDPTLGRHISSGTVLGTKPPEYWTDLGVARHLESADLYLSKPEVKAYLGRHSTPSLEPTFRVRREADIVLYTYSHLTHAVNMALGGAIFPDKIQMTAELQAGAAGSQLRPDFTWRDADSSTADAFAILEVKIPGGIDLDALDSAERSKPNGTNGFNHQNDMVNTVKQLTAYARNQSFDTCYVGSFDGEHLLLCIFSQDAETNPLMRATIVPCQGDRGVNARKALLGWLIEARKEKRRGNNEGLGVGPPIKKLPARR